MNTLCLGNYCNPECKGFDTIQGNLKSLYKKENVINGFHKKFSNNKEKEKEKEKMIKQGAESSCVDPEEFYKIIFPEIKPQKPWWPLFREKYIKK